MRILIELSKNRRRLGWLKLLNDSGHCLHECACLALADNAAAKRHDNPARNPLKKFGDLPTGTYSGTLSAKKLYPATTYGPWKVLRLTPTGGAALEAAKNGRRGFLVHGGVLNPKYTQWAGLRPTHGCLRVTDNDIGLLGHDIGAETVDVEVKEKTA